MLQSPINARQRFLVSSNTSLSSWPSAPCSLYTLHVILRLCPHALQGTCRLDRSEKDLAHVVKRSISLSQLSKL
ncbi:hypothetical protein CC2G_005062 [Coprinopsis cinerea AmutBmut pab1-1]|nr:hypothetical protein CC2G_005062 [Coprinopsis cinerea AmutBmut pab1-1]